MHPGGKRCNHRRINSIYATLPKNYVPDEYLMIVKSNNLRNNHNDACASTGAESVNPADVDCISTSSESVWPNDPKEEDDVDGF